VCYKKHAEAMFVLRIDRATGVVRDRPATPRAYIMSRGRVRRKLK